MFSVVLFAQAYAQLPYVPNKPTNMITDHLHDAAIALGQVLGEADVRFGVFGGYAVSVLGGVRESKDIDCLASVTKDEAVALLDGRNGFVVIPQSRQDYVAFFWEDPRKSRSSNPVLVEIFCERFPGMNMGAPV